MHTDWRLKAKFGRTRSTNQRLTGQATTAIGNGIVNLIVHLPFN